MDSVKCINIPRLLCELLKIGIKASSSTAHRALRKMHYSYKIVRARSVPDLAVFKQRREAFAELLADIDPSDVLSADEASYDSNMTPLRAFGPVGAPLFIPLQRSTRRRVTLTLAVSNTKLEHWSIVNGSSNSKTFMDFLRGLEDTPQQVVLLDNVAFHKSKAAIELLIRMGKMPLFVPPYSPEFNPIENVFSYLKRRYRPMCFDSPGVSHQTVLEQCLTMCKNTFTAQCSGAFAATWAFDPAHKDGS